MSKKNMKWATLENIEKALRSSNSDVRAAAMQACSGKAIIKEIIGDFCGEKVGISVFDKTTAYYAGDEVKIDDFDMSDEECSTGFHFFCTREEAEAY